jgi:hypothetical protein
MRVDVPGTVPEQDRDTWAVAFRAGYLDLKFGGPSRRTSADVTVEQAAVAAHPDAYKAGTASAFKDLNRPRSVRR